MGFAQLPPFIDSRSAPKICRWGSCLEDPAPNSQFCEVHKHSARGRVHVYAVLSAGMIKIGKTLNVKQRVAAISSMSGAETKLLGFIISVPAYTEAAIHRHLAAHRKHGEWFEPTDEVLRIVDFICRQDYQALRALAKRAA
jgi:hypothetical protein